MTINPFGQRLLARQYDFWGNLTDKECGKCGAVRPIKLFCKSKASADGLAGWCTACVVLGNKRISHERQRGLHLKRKYDMSPQDWEDLFNKQGRCCAACGLKEPGAVNWQTDHIHGTKIVRGIICRGCNNAIGHLKDSPERAEQLAAYLRNYNATT